MKTIFDPNVIDALTSRVEKLQPGSRAQWGKMTVWQMLKHCNRSEEMFLGRRRYKRLLIGKLFGRLALRSILKDDSPMKHNQPTHPEMKITGTGDFEAEKQKWMVLLNAYKQFENADCLHPFFGQMSKQQIGVYVYKHTDHHLRQFGY